EAALAPGLAVFRARHLLDVVARFLPDSAGPQPEPSTDDWTQATPAPLRQTPMPRPDLADVKGQAAAKRALEIAAAGGHSLLMRGPPGSGKSMLAQRFSGLLPPMNAEEALESAAVESLAGPYDPARWGLRPTRAPHHTASAVALVGGGSPPRPGEISLAHQGVLFLDELPEFPRAALEALREPLETGRITISRAAQRADFPARFQLIAAMNPCPCGYLGAPGHTCRCTPDQIARYQGRISGPLLDRIDLHVEVVSIPPDELLRAPPGESTAAIRARVVAARQRALARQGTPNQALHGARLDAHAHLQAAATAFLQTAAARLGWSSRAVHRALKVARTIADLASSPDITVTHIAEAVQYRRTPRTAG
ncbi:MAG: YifB family Mg chelatase-like AAA ATPase, partial [Burkholderiaceae bacterium]|nr:YifB family Mg chelatase-like AAA ATPase [Burkholderiaceae bacterium]